MADTRFSIFNFQFNLFVLFLSKQYLDSSLPAPLCLVPTPPPATGWKHHYQFFRTTWFLSFACLWTFPKHWENHEDKYLTWEYKDKTISSSKGPSAPRHRPPSSLDSPQPPSSPPLRLSFSSPGFPPLDRKESLTPLPWTFQIGSPSVFPSFLKCREIHQTKACSAPAVSNFETIVIIMTQREDKTLQKRPVKR